VVRPNKCCDSLPGLFVNKVVPFLPLD
jgi:hypothetical protein